MANGLPESILSALANSSKFCSMMSAIRVKIRKGKRQVERESMRTGTETRKQSRGGREEEVVRQGRHSKTEEEGSERGREWFDFSLSAKKSELTMLL